MIERMLAESRGTLSEVNLQILEERTRSMFETSRTKIRYHRAVDETALNLGVRAGCTALVEAQMQPAEIDLLIYVGVGRGFIEPATANVFQSALGLVNATAFDVLDACASWMRALQIAQALIGAGTYRTVMIMNAECNSREYGNLLCKDVDDLDFRFPALTIGEAATATIVSAGGADFHFSFRTWGSEHVLCKIPLPNYLDYTQGELRDNLTPLEFFSFGELILRSVFAKMIKHYQGDPLLKQFTADLTFGHSASDAMTDRVARCLGLDPVYLTHSRFGNTVSASIPLGMAEARREGKLSPGMNILLGCGSAGITTGWACFRYED